MAYLVLVRHGITEYNTKGMWTGWDDPELTPQGVEEAKAAGEKLKDIHFDFAYTAIFRRTNHTLSELKKVIRQEDLPTTINAALNERNYGDYTKKNKWELQKEVGDEVFQKIRRSWDYPIPNGESLKQVYEREIPYYQTEIEPKLKDGKNVIIVSSGNALRALVKYLENISEGKIASLEIGTGEVYVYTIDENGKVVHKEICGQNPNKGKV